MLHSKKFLVVMIVTLLAMGAALAFQTLEMQEYHLLQTIFHGK